MRLRFGISLSLGVVEDTLYTWLGRTTCPLPSSITAKLTTLAKKSSLLVSSPPDFIHILVTHVNTTWEVLHVLTEGLLGFDWQLWSEYKVSLSSWKKKRKLKIKLLLHVCLFLKTFSISWENKIFVTWSLSWLLNIQGGKCFFANNIYLAFLPASFWRAN